MLKKNKKCTKTKIQLFVLSDFFWAWKIEHRVNEKKKGKLKQQEEIWKAMAEKVKGGKCRGASKQ